MTEETTQEMDKLLDDNSQIALPEVGDVIDGLVISAANSEIFIDINGIATGVVRGPELVDESGLYTHLAPGYAVSATVLELENEIGQLELSFREAGHMKAWEELVRAMKEKDVVEGTIIDANKGGLIVRYGLVTGFLPVSQLTVEHYPRVEGANRQKILARLQTYVDNVFTLRIIDVDEVEGKLIFSEKAAKEAEQSEVLSQYKVGQIVEGKVTGVVDFGAFVEFGDGLEGLVHISELAWQRIDNPKDVISVNDDVKAQIISIDGGKISLSIRRLEEDPWANVAKKYTVGDIVKGTVLKLNPFGAFVELDKDIHGLAHISELSWKKIQSPEEVVKEGEERKFKIVSIEPHNHRLGLSVKQMTEKPADASDGGSEEKPATPVVAEAEVAPTVEAPATPDTATEVAAEEVKAEAPEEVATPAESATEEKAAE